MEFINLKTKYFDFTFGKLKNAFLTVSILFLTGGIGSLTQSFWLQLIKELNPERQKQIDTYSYIIGTIFLFIGFYFLYLFYKSKRNLIYAKAYEQQRQLKNEIFGMIQLQEYKFNENLAETTRQNAYNLYRETLDFIERNKLIINKKIYKRLWDLTQKFGQETIYFEGYIHNMKKYIANDPSTLKAYSPARNLEESKKEFADVFEEYTLMIETLQKKAWWLTEN